MHDVQSLYAQRTTIILDLFNEQSRAGCGCLIKCTPIQNELIILFVLSK